MATGGIAPSTGDGVTPQNHLVGVGPPRILAGEHQSHFRPPTNTVRPPSGAPGVSNNVGSPLFTQPTLESPPSSGPSPLFPPLAVMSRPPQAVGQTMPHFPPPSTSTGTVMGPPTSFPRSIPAYSQPPPLQLPSQQPPTFPPHLPPPNSNSPHPQFSHPGSSIPSTTSSPSQVATNAPQTNIRPPALPPSAPQMLPPSSAIPPQFQAPIAAGPPPVTVGQTPGGMQMTPQHRFPPPNVLPVSTPTSILPHSQQTPPLNEQLPREMPPPARFSPVAIQPPSVPGSHPANQIPTSHTATASTNDTPPLLPSPQKIRSDADVSEGGTDKGREVWYEHKLPDGRVYYSHSLTRKTVWDRPQNVQILPHPAQQNSNSNPTAGNSPTAASSPVPSFPSNASHLVPTRVWSEFKTPEGKVYYYNKITRVSVWEKPKDCDLVMPLPPEIGGTSPATRAEHFPTSNQQQMPHPRPTQSPASRPPLMSTPLAFPPGRLPFNPGFAPGHPTMNPGLIPPHMVPHYPHAPAHLMNASSGDGQLENNVDTKESDSEVMEITKDTGPSGEGVTDCSTAPTSTATEGGDTEVDNAVSADTQTTAPEQVPVKEEPKGPRPTASVPVPGTPWSVVWTTDGRQFFFDVTSRVSLWIMPEELKDNPQLEKILENGRDGDKKPKSDDPPAKRMRLSEEGGEGEGEDEDEEDMEAGPGGLDIPTGAQMMVQVKPAQTEVMETEKKAAMMRSGKTVEERQEEFKEMLLERGVSAFSTWDKELPKFVFDPRYMLLNSKERKNCFEEYIRSRAEEERKEKRSKLKARRDEFRKLLEDCKLHPKSSFSEFAQRNARDERFKAVEKMREREQLFSDYLQELKKTATSSGTSKHKGEKTESGPTHSSTKTKADMIKTDFLEMLSEDHSLSESSQWRKVKGGLERDPRYRAVSGGSSQREEWFKEYVRSLATTSKQVDPSKEREERIQASLKEREREVQMSRSAHEKEWGRERDQLRKTEAVLQFKAMLTDTVRSTSVVWNDARRQLRQDGRWASTGLLEAEEKEKLFQEHCDGLTEKKRLQFRRLLEETAQISLVMPWKKAKKLIRDDPRYKNFTESDHRREVEYDKHLRDKMVTAKNEFRSLLRETKIINYKSHKLVTESEKHYKEIIKVLENDQRFLVLECVSDERERILHNYMEELDAKGPPPPPTATNPSERLRKL